MKKVLTPTRMRAGKLTLAKVVEIARKYQVVKLQQKQGIHMLRPIGPVLKTGEKHLSRNRDGLKLMADQRVQTTITK